MDLKSSFESVDRAALCKAMRVIGTPTVLLNLIKDLYDTTHARIRLGQNLSLAFEIKSGVRQGCVLAPALFCNAIEWLLERSFEILWN